MTRLTVFIVTGHLGAGKSTLIREFLARSKQVTGVIINEAGDVDIDTAVVMRDMKNARYRAFPGECLCCMNRGDLPLAIEALQAEARGRDGVELENVIVELSGLAVPGPLLRELGAWRRPIQIVTLCVFGVTCEAQIAQSQPETVEQITVADRIVLTKQDVAGCDDRQRVLEYFAECGFWGEVIDEDDKSKRAEKAFCVPDRGPDVTGGEALASIQRDGSLGYAHEHTNVKTISLINSQFAYDEMFLWSLEQVVYELDSTLLRMKGLVDLGKGDKYLLVQSVGSFFAAPEILSSVRIPNSILVFILRCPHSLIPFKPLESVGWQRLAS